MKTNRLGPFLTRPDISSIVHATWWSTTNVLAWPSWPGAYRLQDVPRFSSAISLLWIVTFLWDGSFSHSQDTGGHLWSLSPLEPRYFMSTSPLYINAGVTPTLNPCRHYAARRYLDAHDYPDQIWIALSPILPLKEHSGHMSELSLVTFNQPENPDLFVDVNKVVFCYQIHVYCYHCVLQFV